LEKHSLSNLGLPSGVLIIVILSHAPSKHKFATSWDIHLSLVRRRGSSISPVLLMAVKRYAAVRVSGHAKKNQDVLAPYVYFSVGPASAMGSGRVGCSSYLSSCPFLSILRPHTVYIMFFFPSATDASTIYTGLSSSRCFPRSSSLGSYWAKLSWVGDQRAHSTSFAVLLTCFFLVVCTARLVGFLPFVALRTAYATTDPREIMRIWGLGVPR
jgi:hypothetical protein